MNFKAWYSISLLFLFYSLYQLCNQKFEINYQLSKGSYTYSGATLNLTTCIWTKEILYHQTLLNKQSFNKSIKQPQTNVIVSEFLKNSFEFLNSTFYEEIRNEKPNEDPRNYELPFRKNNSFMLLNQVCYVTNQSLYSNLYFLRKFTLKLLALSNKSNGHYPHFTYSLRNESTFNKIKISKIITETLSEPYSDCANEWTTINSTIVYTKFDCINACLKNKKRYNFYAYYEDDDNYLDLLDSNYSNFDDKIICNKECRRNDCTLEQYLAVMDDSYRVFNIDLEAYPSLSKLDFYLQFFGLISMFINCSINETVPFIACLILKFICEKLKKNDLFFAKLTFYIKLIVLLISLSITIPISAYLICNYHFYQYEPIRSAISDFTIKNKPFSLILCIPIQFIKFGKIKSADSDKEILNNFSFKEIENFTRLGYEKAIRNWYLTYGSKKEKIIVNLNSRKIYFRQCDYELKGLGELKLFSRCFRMEFEKNELQYDNLLSISALVVKLNEKAIHYLNVYLVDVEKEFNNDAFQYERRFKLLRTINRKKEKSIISNCTDYAKSKCKSKSSCASLCIYEKYSLKHKSLPVNALIDQDFFGDKQILNYKFNVTNDETIKNECFMNNSKNDCLEIYFMPSYKTQVIYNDRLEINLSFETVEITEFDISFGKLLLALINVCSIFFGLNLIKFTRSLAKFIGFTSESRLVTRGFKQVAIAFYSLGFLTHVYLIFYDIVYKNEFISSGYYFRNNTMDLADLTFCFEFNQSKIDIDHQLTGSYIANATSDITFESVFKKIKYLNDRHKIVTLNATELQTASNFNTHIYLHKNMKCLVINPEIWFRDEEFYLENELYSIKLYLTEFAKLNELYFLAKKKDSKEMNELYKFKFFKDHSKKNETYKYLVNIVTMTISFVDNFRYFKNPLCFFLDEQDSQETTIYLENMERATKTKYEFLTKTFPLDYKNFNTTINDQLFEQFFRQVQDVNDNYICSAKYRNSKRELYHTYVRTSIVQNNDLAADFEFAPSESIQITSFKNAHNVASLIQNLLNAASLWLDLCILDLYAYLNRISNPFFFIHQKLISFKSSKFDSAFI